MFASTIRPSKLTAQPTGIDEGEPMKTYAVVITLEIDESNSFDHPAKWQFDELIGGEVRGWTVFDVTDEPIERVRIDAFDAEVIA